MTVELKMTVNTIEVNPCTCSKDEIHWSVRDMAEAIGRRLMDADCVRIEATVIGEPE